MKEFKLPPTVGQVRGSKANSLSGIPFDANTRFIVRT